MKGFHVTIMYNTWTDHRMGLAVRWKPIVYMLFQSDSVISSLIGNTVPYELPDRNSKALIQIWMLF